MTQKNILIVGGGSIGKRHLRNLLSLGEKNVAMMEPNAERAEELKKEFGIIVFSSLAEALEKMKVNIAFVCSPSVYHMEQAIALAEYGADLFIEKPLSHSLEGLEKLEKIVKEKKLVTMVGSNWKFYPLFQKMKELLDAGEIGRVLGARCQFGQYLPYWHPWEDYRRGYSANKKLGGGILLDSHEFDYLTWFLGKPVQSLACFASKVSDLEIDVEDSAEVLLRFSDGTIGEIHLDYLQKSYQRNFEFFGEKANMIWDTNLKTVVVKSKEGGEKARALSADYDINKMYVDEARHFLECVDARRETMTAVTHGAEVLRLIAAAKESAEKEKIIKLK